MSTTNPPHNPVTPGGEISPQVVVRAGKTWVCSACGVLIELPADVVGQMVVLPDPSEPSARPSPTPHEQSPENEPLQNDAGPDQETASPSPGTNRAGMRRPKRLPSAGLPRERIDGLIVPTTEELQRLLSWIDYRLKRLNTLRQFEKQSTKPWSSRSPRREANKVPMRKPWPVKRRHAHADVGMAPSSSHTNQRGPP